MIRICGKYILSLLGKPKGDHYIIIKISLFIKLYLHHGVRSVFILHAHKVENLCSIGHKNASKKGVDKIHLADNIDKVEDITEEIPVKEYFLNA